MIIEDALARGYFKVGNNWYKPRTFILNGKHYKSRQKMTTINCAVCGKLSIAAQKKINTCSKSCFFKQFKGEKNHRWKGGGMTGDGYKWIYVTDNPMADVRGRVREHRYIMSQIIGRPLKNNEHVHHINENKLDNKPENLILVSRKEHMEIHARKRAKSAPRDISGRFT